MPLKFFLNVGINIYFSIFSKLSMRLIHKMLFFRYTTDIEK